MPSAQGIRAGRAFVELFADDSKLVRGLKAAQRKLRTFAAGVNATGTKLMAAGGAMFAPAAAGLKTFADFETNLAKLATLLDQPQQHMENFKKGLRDLAMESGEGLARGRG